MSNLKLSNIPQYYMGEFTSEGMAPTVERITPNLSKIQVVHQTHDLQRHSLNRIKMSLEDALLAKVRNNIKIMKEDNPDGSTSFYASVYVGDCEDVSYNVAYQGEGKVVPKKCYDIYGKEI